MANSKNTTTTGKVNIYDLLKAPAPVTAKKESSTKGESFIGTVNREIHIVIPAGTVSLYKSTAGNLTLKHPSPKSMTPMRLVDTKGKQDDQVMELGIGMAMPRIHGGVIKVDDLDIDSLNSFFGTLDDLEDDSETDE